MYLWSAAEVAVVPDMAAAAAQVDLCRLMLIQFRPRPLSQLQWELVEEPQQATQEQLAKIHT
jgi:hypothetical protein